MNDYSSEIGMIRHKKIQRKKRRQRRRVNTEENPQQAPPHNTLSIDTIARKPVSLWNEQDILTAQSTLGNSKTATLLNSGTDKQSTGTIQRSFEDVLNFWKGLEGSNNNAPAQETSDTSTETETSNQNTEAPAETALTESNNSPFGKLTQEELDQRIASGNMDFSGLDLSGLDLTKKYLMGAKFVATNLTGANLNQAMVSNAQFIRANLTNTNMKGVFADKATFINVDFSGADLSNGFFNGANLTTCTVDSSTKLKGASLTKASITQTQLKNMDLSFANFKQANLAYNDFSGSIFMSSDLEGAIFSYANLNNTTIVTSMTEGADFAGATFIGAKVSINFDKIFAKGTDFSTVVMPTINMYYLSQQGAKTLMPAEQLKSMAENGQL